MRLTFVNNGTPFSFRTDKMTKHPDGNRGATMLQVHAELVLQTMDENVYILGTDGRRLSAETVKACAKSGVFPTH